MKTANTPQPEPAENPVPWPYDLTQRFQRLTSDQRATVLDNIEWLRAEVDLPHARSIAVLFAEKTSARQDRTIEDRLAGALPTQGAS